MAAAADESGGGGGGYPVDGTESQRTRGSNRSIRFRFVCHATQQAGAETVFASDRIPVIDLKHVSAGLGKQAGRIGFKLVRTEVTPKNNHSIRIDQPPILSVSRILQGEENFKHKLVTRLGLERPIFRIRTGGFHPARICGQISGNPIVEDERGRRRRGVIRFFLRLISRWSGDDKILRKCGRHQIAEFITQSRTRGETIIARLERTVTDSVGIGQTGCVCGRNNRIGNIINRSDVIIGTSFDKSVICCGIDRCGQHVLVEGQAETLNQRGGGIRQ